MTCDCPYIHTYYNIVGFYRTIPLCLCVCLRCWGLRRARCCNIYTVGCVFGLTYSNGGGYSLPFNSINSAYRLCFPPRTTNTIIIVTKHGDNNKTCLYSCMLPVYLLYLLHFLPKLYILVACLLVALRIHSGVSISTVSTTISNNSAPNDNQAIYDQNNYQHSARSLCTLHRYLLAIKAAPVFPWHHLPFHLQFLPPCKPFLFPEPGGGGVSPHTGWAVEDSKLLIHFYCLYLFSFGFLVCKKTVFVGSTTTEYYSRYDS